MTRLILLNGPPRVGKDTAARHLVERLGAVRMGFADHLKLATHASYGLLDAEGRPLPFDAFEAVKDQPREEFHGLTPRAAYIAHSERYQKPLHGPLVFGTYYLRGMLRRPEARLWVAPDSGFAREAEVPMAHIGACNVLLVRIRGEARGKSYDGDSRSYIDMPGVMSLDLANDAEGEPGPFLEAVESAARVWLA